MNLVKELNNAAIWNIKLLNIDSQIVDAESGIPSGMLVLLQKWSTNLYFSFTRFEGAFIQFELLDAKQSSDALGASAVAPTSSLLLAFESVDGGGGSKPAIIESQQTQDGKQNLLTPQQLPQPPPQSQQLLRYSQHSTDGEGSCVDKIILQRSSCDHGCSYQGDPSRRCWHGR